MKRWIIIALALIIAVFGYIYWQSAQLPPDIEVKGEKIGLDAYVAIVVSICGAVTAMAQMIKAILEARKASKENK